MEDKSDKTPTSFRNWVVSPANLALLLLMVVMLSLGVYLYINKAILLPFLANNQVTIAPTPTPTPRPIPHGAKGFTVSQTDRTVPQMSRGSIDPYDPERGATQTVTVAVKHKQPVTEVTAVLKTDHAVSSPFPFTLTSGTSTNGEWQGSWQVTDTYLYKYALVLEATSGTKTAKVEITLR